MPKTQEPFKAPTPISETEFKGLINKQAVHLYTLKNAQGLVAQLSNYGARLVSLFTPDKHGHSKDIVLGFDKATDYEMANEAYYGATVGRYANRIANARFNLDGKEFELENNNGPNNLHGGSDGFHARVWHVEEVDSHSVTLSLVSPNMDQGFPGELKVWVTYTLTDDNELAIKYKATTNQTTLVNLTHHSFFNLKGAGEGNIYENHLHINADSFCEVNEFLIPQTLKSVADTPFDFRKPQAMGARMNENHQQLKYGNGYDHNWILTKDEPGLSYAAKVLEPSSSRVMEVFTSEPGIQFYGANWLAGNDIGKQGKTYERHGAFCLETQHYPDSPNQSAFPSVVLKPEESYQSICIYKFSVDK